MNIIGTRREGFVAPYRQTIHLVDRRKSVTDPGYEKASSSFGRWQYQHGRANVIPSPVPGVFHRVCRRGSSYSSPWTPETLQHVTPLSFPGRGIGQLLRFSAPSSQNPPSWAITPHLSHRCSALLQDDWRRHILLGTTADNQRWRVPRSAPNFVRFPSQLMPGGPAACRTLAEHLGAHVRGPQPPS